MRHPFDGIEAVGRRGFLAGLLGLGAGLVVSQAASAAAPPVARHPLTEALHEQGGHSTAALGEEGGGRLTEALHEQGRPLTEAMPRFEQGGSRLTEAEHEQGGPSRPLKEDGVTTMMLGEEGGKPGRC